MTAVFGNGLAFNFFEDKFLDFDNRPFGLRMDVELNEQFQLMSLIGSRSEFSSYSHLANRTPDIFTNFDVAGVQVNYFPDNGDWNSGAYITGTKFMSPVEIVSLDPVTLTPSQKDTLQQNAFILNGGLTYTIYREKWEWTFEYGSLKKWFDIPVFAQNIGSNIEMVESISDESGNVFYSQLTGTLPDNSSLTFEYKLYQIGEGQIIQNESGSPKTNFNRRAVKAMPFHLGPTLLRQHDIGLLANLTHAVDYGDEVGYNIDYRKNLGEKFLLTGIYAQASRTSAHEETGGSYFPSLELDYYPFQELYFELEYSGYVLQNRMMCGYTEFSLDRFAKEKYITFIPAYFSRITGPFVLGGSLGIQKALKSGKEYYNHQYILSIDWKRKFSFSLITDLSSDPAITENSQWVSGEISYKPSPILTLRTSYGTEKGGIRCTGGVCRYISPFDGVRMTLEVRM